MTPEQIDLIARSFEGGLSREEEARLETLLEGSSEARRELGHYQAVRAALKQGAEGGFGPGFEDRIMRRLARKPEPARSWLPEIRWPTLAPIGIATALVLVAAGWWFTRSELSESRNVAAAPESVERYDIPPGGRRTVNLPDGSTVDLGPGSSLEVQVDAESPERVVRLIGEAFFNISHDGRSFIVQTFNARIRVLGTRFNVRARPDDPAPTTEVALEEGSVEVAGDVGGAVRLRPGEGTTIVADSGSVRPPEPVALREALAWRTGGMAFTDRTLGAVFNEIERRYAVRIDVADPSVESMRITYLNPSPPSPEGILSDLGHARGFRFSRTANGFAVTAP